MYKRIISIATVAALGAVLFAGIPGAAAPSAVFLMHARNGSKLDGTVILERTLGPAGRPAVSVAIKLNGVFIPEAMFPAGIYAGGCTNTLNGPPKWALRAVQNGTSTTVVYGVTIKDLEGSQYSVAVASEKDPHKVLACGVLTPR